MDTPFGRKESLNPNPGVIVEFILAVVETPWPLGTEQPRNYIERRGCELGPSGGSDDETLLGVTRGAFVIPRIATINALWAAIDGSLFSLNFFTYANARNVITAVDAGYDAVKNGLIGLYGQPLTEQKGPSAYRSADWAIRDTLVELYLHVLQAPMLQIGLCHRERNAAYEHRIAQSADRPRA